MVKNLFSVPIFFIVFRETIEAAIIVSTLLGLAQQIAYDTQSPTDNTTSTSNDINKERDGASTIPPAEETVTVRQLARKLKIQVSCTLFVTFARCSLFIQIFAGAAVGIVIALAIGAAYVISVYRDPEPYS
jgi:high-affinity iron transporter